MPALTEPQIETLATMLSFRRPHGSRTERAFNRQYVASLPDVWRDEHRNYRVTIGQSRVLWSCHTDTVHHQGGRQVVKRTSDDVLMLANKQDKANRCLGADDGLGVFLLCEMIRAKVPGHYFFHYGEEVGGIGSSAVAKACDIAPQIDYAIALDRAGNSDVVTHQLGMRTCSDAFAQSLARQLTTQHLPGYTPAHGVYTDTAEYMDIVSECTNLSVGYYAQHTANEIVDLTHVGRLLHALLHFDETALVCERVPFAPDDDPTDPDDAHGDIRAYRLDTDDRYDDDDEDDWSRLRTAVCECCEYPHRLCTCTDEDIAFWKYLKGQ